ncbi:MAG: hypothetical protein M1813_001908 [Trichoglossum hirsutum]|nr:MAG: hypothetical protein M1813_001908 [Trichoglossum hirsutum]
MIDLGDTLVRLGLSQYFERFIQEGFDTWETVLDITETDLEALDVKLGHRRRLQREIASSRGQSTDQPLSPTSRLPPTEGGALDREARASLTKCEFRDNIGNGKRKYRRHPKTDKNAPERAPSAYVIFTNKIREDVKDQNLSFTETAKLVGERWQMLPTMEKDIYESQALVFKEKYNTELIEYRKTVSYREYTEYLANFKAKTIKDQIGKRSKLENHRHATSTSRPSGAPPPGGGARVGTYDSTSSQTSPSTVHPHAPLLIQPTEADTPLESPPTLAQRGYGASTQSRGQRGIMENIPSAEEPRDLHPDSLPGVQRLRGMLSINTAHQGSCLPGCGSLAGGTQTVIPHPNPMRRSPMESNHDSRSSGSSSSHAPAILREDQNNRVQRALPPPPVISTSPSAGQGFFGYSHAASQSPRNGTSIPLTYFSNSTSPVKGDSYQGTRP